MKYQRLLWSAACLAMAACSDPNTSASVDTAAEPEASVERENPLLAEWNTPFGVPPFDLIESTDYLPALRSGVQQHQAEIDAIAANPDAPTFDNTIVALETSGATLTSVRRPFFAVNSAHADDVIRETAKTIAPELSAHRDNIFLNAALFERVDAVYRMRDQLDLDIEQQRLLEETHKDFVRSGANLEPEAQARLREINSELATLSQQFQENLLNETNEFEVLVTDRADLGDLPESLVALAAEEAKRRGHDCDECWAFTLQRPSINPFLQYSPNRELRRTLFEGYAMRGDNDNENDNKTIVQRTVQLRAERAAMMGYETHAHYVLSDNMAETPQNAFDLLDQVWKPALRTYCEAGTGVTTRRKSERPSTILTKSRCAPISRSMQFATVYSPWQQNSSASRLSSSTTSRPGIPTNRCSKSGKPTARMSPSCTWTISPARQNAAAHG
jgi:peptidyl-dipeptidase Dcp